MAQRFSPSNRGITAFRELDMLFGNSLMPEMPDDACFDELHCGL